MCYYYVKYNVYGEAQPPAEHEAWLQFPEHNDESGIKRHLGELHNAGITIIRSSRIGAEQYSLKQKENY